MLAALGTVADLENRLGVEPGSIEGNDFTRAESALADASTLVRAEAGVPWVDADGVPYAPDVVVTVVVKAAIRGYRNPDGVGSESYGGAYFYNYAPGETSIYLTDEEKEIVRRAARTSATWSGTGTIRTPSAYGPASSATIITDLL